MLMCAALSCVAQRPPGVSSSAESQPIAVLAHVGPAADGGMIVATRQVLHPAGRSIEFHGRPIDLLLLSRDQKTAFVKSDFSVFVIDLDTGAVRQELKYPPKTGASLHGIALTPDGTHLYVTLAQSAILEMNVAADGALSIARTIPVRVKKEGESYPCGIALSADASTAVVCLSCNNCVAIVDLATGQVTGSVPVEVAPYDVELSPDGATAYVSDWGGRRATKDDKTSISAGTPIVIDNRGIASTGAVSIVDMNARKEVSQIPTGLHPSDLLLTKDGRTLYVANANSDSVGVIDTRIRGLTRAINIRPDAKLMFGSAPNGLALSRDEKTLFVANGGNNAVAVVSTDDGDVCGFLPTGWYPGALAMRDDDELIVANVKGLGSRDPKQNGTWSTRYGAWGSASVVRPPNDRPELHRLTERVRADAMVPQSLAAMERGRRGGEPMPVPRHVGEPSVFRHVVYVIKENRTYDQVLGDIGRGNSDSSLCIYGRRVTPNQHALAEQFVLLDNYYCNGILSTDGHHWATEGVTTDYIEKSFGAWVRSYPSTGDDPLAYAPSGFLWDDALLHGLSFRNYGEFRYDKLEPFARGAASRPSTMPLIGDKRVHLGLQAIAPYTCPDFPGYTTEILDVERTDVFIRELHEFEKKGDWPNLMVVYLPNNHTNGMTPGSRTPDAMVADNDLAVGKIVDAISHSRFWRDTCVFVTEDDPQDGFDHVDGHRSPCLVVSAYTKRGAVVSNFYNQTSVLRTIELMLGLPPMNQFDSMSPAMFECFSEKADLRPFDAVPNRVSLEDRNPPKTALRGEALEMAERSERLKLDVPDQANENELNRILWFAAKPQAEYPTSFAGAHGRGLRRLNLRLSDDERDDD
jgi:YVTN family beta-propeller protein